MDNPGSIFSAADSGVIAAIIHFTQHAHPLLLFVAALLAASPCFFLWYFIGPSFRLSRKLRSFSRELHALKQRKMTDPRGFEIADERLSHLWLEYCDTLHQPQDSLDPVTGVSQLGRYRATVPAEVIFNSPSVFEGRFHAEFFKNLPGLLTGLGIIGTFIGLINGLGAANKGDGALDTVLLIASVKEAFYVSAAAIMLAMLATFIEKWVVSNFHRRVEQLCQEIDSLYTSGAGEEYLSRLVNASEESAAQARILKDALVGDLRRILEEMTQKQIAASNNHQADMTRSLAGFIEQAVGQPMGQMAELMVLGGSSERSLQDSIAALGEKFERVATGIERLGSSQGDQIAEGLSGSMLTFADKLDQMLGGQIGQARDLQAKTTESLEKAILSIEGMAAKIGSAGEGAASVMGEQLRSALTEMAERQRIMGDSMRAVADELRASVTTAQSSTSQGVENLLNMLGGQVNSTIGRLQGESQALTAFHQDQISQISEQTNASLAQLSGAVQAQTKAIERATGAMRGAIDDLGSAVHANISRMAEGAGEIRLASEQFVGSGRTMSDVLDRSRAVAVEFTQLAQTLSASSHDVRTVVSDYRAARENFASIVAGLSETIGNARRDASMTTEMFQSMKGAADELVKAQGDAEAYLARLTGVLADAHSSFTSGMKETLQKSNTAFHEHLNTSVSLLASSIDDLEIVLGKRSEPPMRVA